MEVSMEDIVAMDEASTLMAYGERGAGKSTYMLHYGQLIHQICEEYENMIVETYKRVSLKEIFYKYHSTPFLLSVFIQALVSLAFQKIILLLPFFLILSIPMIAWDIKEMYSRKHRRYELF